MHRSRVLTPFSVLLSLAFSAQALAGDFDIETPDQDAFGDVAKDITAALNYKALGPAEPSGLTGFSIGVFGSYVPVENEDAWETLTGDEVGEIGTVGISASKGLPFGVDVGAFYSAVPGTDGNLFGAELRYAVWKGGIASPAVAVRASYTKLSGVDDIDYDSTGLDVSISKGFTLLTPYAGAGMVFGTVDAADEFGLDKEDVDVGRFFAGVRMTLGFLALTPEYEHVGDSDVFSLRVSLGL